MLIYCALCHTSVSPIYVSYMLTYREFIIFSQLFCTFDTFPNEKLKRKEPVTLLLFFHLSIN